MSMSRLRFTFSCQRCGSVLEASGDMAARSGRCPTCGAVFTVPDVDPNTGLAAGPATVADDGQLPTPMHAYATAGGKAPTIRRLPNGDSVIVCPRCNRNMPVDANLCGSCGLPFTMEGASTAAESVEYDNAKATAALTVGVLSLLTFCFPILGVVAVILGLRAMRDARRLGVQQSGRSMAIAGIVCGGLSITAFAVWGYMTNLF
ncbi:MAG: DUF4190 domain-containing protein [Planctomycetota bacterium]